MSLRSNLSRWVGYIGLKWSPSVRSMVALSLPMLFTIAIFTAWMATRSGTNLARRWVEHTEAVIFEANQMLLMVTQLESGLRRYAITREPQDIAFYQQAKVDLTSLSDRLYQRLQDNPDQQQKWREIQSLAQSRISSLDELLQQSQQSSSSTAISVSNLERGQAAMGALTESMAEFQREERQYLTMREQRLNQLSQLSTFVGWSLLIGSLCSSAGAIYLFRILDSERAETGDELDHSQQLLKAIASSVVDGVILLNENLEVREFNRSACEMFGYREQDVHGHPISDFFEVSQPMMLELNDQSVQSQILSIQGIRQTGQRFPTEVSLSHTVRQQRILIVRDVSERESAQQQLENYSRDLEQVNLALSRSNRALTQRNKELDQFAYLAAHDLRAPLRAITSLSGWIEDDLGDQLTSESHHHFELLYSRAKRLQRLIDGLALYTQIGQAPITLESIDVRSLLHEVIEAQEIPGNFTVTLPPELPTVIAHRSYLSEIFAQLLENAVRFHPGPDGNIQIRYWETPTAWHFSVVDDGSGIEPEYHDRIFGVFQTLLPRDKVESTGIGLSIVAKILMTVGGEVSMTSEPGSGSCFDFYWPKSLTSLTNDSL